MAPSLLSAKPTMETKKIAEFESALKATNITDMSEPEQTSLIFLKTRVGCCMCQLYQTTKIEIDHGVVSFTLEQQRGGRSRISINPANSFPFTTVKSALMERRLPRMMKKKKIAEFELALKKMKVTDMSLPEQTALINKYNSCYKRLHHVYDFSLDNDTMLIYFNCWQLVTRLNFQDYFVPKQQST
jgi:hypothetical protein